MSYLRRKVINLAAFTIIDTVLNRFVKLFAVFILINFIPIENIGILGLAGSYLVFIQLILVAPENILLRKSKDELEDRKHSNSLISIFINFNLLRNVCIFLISLIVGYALFQANILLFITFVALVLNLLLESTQELIKLIFYVNFQQKKVTKINLLNNSIFLFSYIFLFFFPSLVTYAIILIITQIIAIFVWILVLKSSLSFHYKYKKGWTKNIINNLKEFSFWQHMNTSVMNFIYQIDPFILSFYVSLSLIGIYTIALKISNFFFLIPMLLQKSTTVHISNKTDRIAVKNVLKKYIGIYGLISIGQLLFFIIFGKLIIHHLFSQDNIDPIYRLTLIILTGISILNIFRPLISITVSKMKLRSTFFYVYLPSFVLSVILYLLLGYIYGMYGVAYANIINFSVFSILLFYFYKNHY